MFCDGFTRGDPFFNSQFTFAVPFQGQVFQQDGEFSDDFIDWRLREFGAPDIPFIIRIWIVFLVSIIAAMIVSRMTSAPDEDRTVKLGDIAFATSTLFNTLAAITVAVLIGLYVWLW